MSGRGRHNIPRNITTIDGDASLLRPIAVFVLHYATVAVSTLVLHDLLVVEQTSDADDEDESAAKQVGRVVSGFLFAYTALLFGTRCLSSFTAGRLRQHAVFYELTWLCNTTLFMSACSLGGWSPDSWVLRRRPAVATAFCVSVSVDQILWYLDVMVYFATGRFPVGVAKYLTWTQTLWIDKMTCTHHLWTIPLALYGSRQPLTFDSYKLNVAIVATHVLLSRWLTSESIMIASKDASEEQSANARQDPSKYRYLNVNLSHSLWKDIKLDFVQISRDEPGCFQYMFRLLLRWQVFNLMTFVLVLRPLSHILLSISYVRSSDTYT